MPRPVQWVYGIYDLPKLEVQYQRLIPNENTKNKPPSFTFFKILKAL